MGLWSFSMHVLSHAFLKFNVQRDGLIFTSFSAKTRMVQGPQ